MAALTPDELAARLAFAVAIARRAGERLVRLRASGRWTDPGTLGDVGDQAADGFLQGALSGRFPADAVLSEETAPEPGALGAGVTWIVDPLDGTREYSSGRHDWAGHVGLAIGGRAVLGAVALPAIDRVVSGCCEPLAEPVLAGEGGDWPHALAADDPAAGVARPLRIVVSRSHTPSWIHAFGDAIGGVERVPCGSVGFKVAMLLFGRADLYVHRTGLQHWDTCAPEAVARAAGFAICRFDGKALRYDGSDRRHGEFVACRPQHLERVLAALHAVAR